MFEAVEIGSEVSRQEYEAQQPGLRVDLINAQFDLRTAGFAVILTISGNDRSGCDGLLALVHEWMDARWIETHVPEAPTEEERERPVFWRFWRNLPPRGRIGLFAGGWGFHTIFGRLRGDYGRAEFERRIGHAGRFEQLLVDDGALLLKFWLHIPKQAVRERVRKARKGRRIDERDWTVLETYDEALPLVEHYISATDSADAPWRIVESTDSRHRDLTVMRTIRDALVARLAEHDPGPSTDSPSAVFTARPEGTRGLLEEVDLSRRLEHEEYRPRLEELQARLSDCTRKARKAGLSCVLVFEGWDAAGKGGVIRRITHAMTARDYRIVPISAPTDEELARHWLWRFWRQLPRAGKMVVFDRSWYGRVLVERVEGLAPPHAWQRAYGEINDFEEQLLEHGTPVLKFWLHIDRDEQLRRFEARERTPYKKYKLTDEDYRNRERWDAYGLAVEEMVTRTSRGEAPWHLVPANDKRWARVRVLETICAAYDGALS